MHPEQRLLERWTQGNRLTTAQLITLSNWLERMIAQYNDNRQPTSAHMAHQLFMQIHDELMAHA
jgi:hypothetical protein